VADPARQRLSARRARPGAAEGPSIRLWLAALAVVVLFVLAAHGPVLSSQALCLDDNEFLTDNALVRQPGWRSVERFFGEVLSPSTVGGYYIPLAMTSLMIDAALGGHPDDLRPFHRTALLLHVASTLLLAILLHQLLRSFWPAVLAALLFGVHPLTVEPVAWVGERKTLLAGFFALLALVLYARHARRPGRLPYLGSLAAFVLALLSKPTSLPLPLLLVLLDAWPLRRLGRAALIEKIPFFALAAASLAIALVSHSRTASLGVFATYTPLQAALMAVYKPVFYLAKVLYPSPLTPVYVPPQPFGIGNPVVLGSALLGLGIAALLVAGLRRTRAPLVAGLLYFCALAPTLGAVQYSWILVSDKYLYPLPLLGLLLAAACLLARAWPPPPAAASGAPLAAGSRAAGGAAPVVAPGSARAWSGRRLAAAVLVLLLAVAATAAARAQYAHWRSTETIYGHMLRHAPGEALLHSNYALELQRRGRPDEALRALETAARLRPEDARIQANLGSALVQLGRFEEALPRFTAALATTLAPAQVRSSLGNALVSLGRFAEADGHFREALRIDPRSADAHTNLGRALAMQGDLEGAIASFRQAIACDPLLHTAHGNLGGLLARRGDHAAALAHYETALRIEPRFAEAHSNMAVSLAALGRPDEAAARFREALRLAPHLFQAHRGLGDLQAARGRWSEALREYEAALRIQPRDPQARAGAERARAALAAPPGR